MSTFSEAMQEEVEYFVEVEEYEFSDDQVTAVVGRVVSDSGYANRLDEVYRDKVEEVVGMKGIELVEDNASLYLKAMLEEVEHKGVYSEYSEGSEYILSEEEVHEVARKLVNDDRLNATLREIIEREMEREQAEG